ncbi:MAG: protein kinase [Candidatus Aminicenantes bacterium]|jgi:serine/threonine protein kinase/dienelactone hydrolase
MECPECQAAIPDDSRFCSKCGSSVFPIDGIFISQTRTILKPIEELSPGTELAEKYRIEDVVGRGGMGIVYKAEDTKLKRRVALKFLPPELIQDEEARERFILEARTAASLSHPNICTIHEINEESGRSFIAMEYLEGQNLKDKLREGPLEADEVSEIAFQIAQGLAEAHKKGIVHRDIKPANIMITEKGQAKVMDFGLAKVKGTTLLTREGTTLGTVAYMSPEQARGGEVDHRTDIWSLGVVLYEMLSGELPFKGDREASILYSVVHEEPKPLKDIKRGLPSDLQQIVNRALKKKPESRYSSAAEMLDDLRKYRDVLHAEELGAFNLQTIIRRIRKPRVAIPAICAVILIALAAVWFFNRQAKIRWARQEILPEIERLLEGNFRDFYEPYTLAEEAERYIPDDPELAEIFSKCSVNINIETEPPGADIYVKKYESPVSEWEYLGVSPLEKVRLPIGIFRWKIEKQGYETVLAASANWNVAATGKSGFAPHDLSRVLDKKGNIPEGMVRVAGTKTPIGELDDFFIDRYEVTNKQYKEFMGNGGYQNKAYWKHEFIKDGEVLTWEEAMTVFVDQTDRPGPSTWQAGDYPEGQDNYPVSGISWYEAAAYAEFAGKSLPTGTHWGIARGEGKPMIQWFQFGGNALFAPFSNFFDSGPVPVGNLPGITSYGAYDMAGNVREWCWNETPKGRMTRGGAWNDPTYAFGSQRQSFAFDRSPENGFRCALYPDPGNIPEAVFHSARLGETKDFYKEKPVPDSIFEVYKEQFSYDKTDLNALVEWTDESHDDWIQEGITFDAAYGGERMIAVLFLPKNAKPPYQTVIYFPGVQATWRKSSREIESSREFQVFLSFVVKNGRAALYPVYKGTMERNFKRPDLWADSYNQTEYRVQVVKDFKRCIDYLETRPDIDSQKFAYYGMSWGGYWPGVIIPAVEERLKACVLLPGGLGDTGRPEVHPIHYVTRVKTPTLMLNGKYDANFAYETSSKPLYDLLGTPDEDKELKLYDTDHIPPLNESIKEILAWLDKYLGPVKR